MNKIQIVYKNIDELKNYKNNPRINDKAVPKLVESIRQFGFKTPIILDKNNVIVCGHTRLKAAQKLGLKEIPCIIADDLTPAQIKAYRLADNKVAELAEWDLDLLNAEIKEIEDIDLNDFGFSVQKISEMVDGLDLDEVGNDFLASRQQQHEQPQTQQQENNNNNINNQPINNKSINNNHQQPQQIEAENVTRCHCPKCGFIFEVKK